MSATPKPVLPAARRGSSCTGGPPTFTPSSRSHPCVRRRGTRGSSRISAAMGSFDDATFDRTAASFENPDHVDTVIHNYRWRLGLAQGEPRYDELEKRLAASPLITVPAITLEGDANGAPHPDSIAYASKFSGRYSHRLVKGGIGHNLPQEAPRAFAKAIVEVDRY